MFFKYLIVTFFAIVTVNCAALYSVSPLSQIQRRQNSQCNSVSDGPIVCSHPLPIFDIGEDCAALLQDLFLIAGLPATSDFFTHNTCIMSWDQTTLTQTPTFGDFIAPLLTMRSICQSDDGKEPVRFPKVQLANGDCTQVGLSTNRDAVGFGRQELCGVFSDPPVEPPTEFHP